MKSAGVLSVKGVERMLAEHASGKRNLYDLIHAASVFHLWLEHVRHEPPAVISRPWNVEGARKILLVNLAGLGDIVMMTPALRAIRSVYPDARVELLTIDRSQELAEGIPGLDKIHSVPVNYRFIGPVGLFVLIRTLLKLRRERFDALVNFSLISSFAGLLKARLINSLVRPALALCRALAGLGAAAGDYCAFEETIEKKSEVELTARLLVPLGIELRDRDIGYTSGFTEKRKVSLDLSARGISGRPVIGLNPGAFRPSRRWPLEGWKSLTRLLLERYPSAVLIVTGSASEKELAGSLKISDRVFSAAGVYSLRETVALYGLVDVFITNDTGPMHLAAAAGAKTVCIFGPGDHWRFAPSVPASRVRLLRKEVPGCEIPCYRFHCKNPVCLSSISPEETLAAVDALLSTRVNKEGLI